MLGEDFFERNGRLFLSPQGYDEVLLIFSELDALLTVLSSVATFWAGKVRC